MKFINPKIDFAFKKIFGSEENKPILISFLNGLLYPQESTIEDLEILNPYLSPKIRGIKETYLDVKARLENGTAVIIEMQVLNTEGFEKRILYNAAKSYSTQLATGESYMHLNPVIALTVTDFILFPDFDQVDSCFILKEREFLTDYPDLDIQLFFMELPKFEKSLEELETLGDRWLFFLRYASQLNEIPETLAQIPALHQAFMAAEQAQLTLAELDELESQAFRVHDQRNAITRAVREATEKVSRASEERGDRKARLAIAKNLMTTLDLPTISQMTELTLEELQALNSDPATHP
jgi:predicted transposase/invertase (TIGR01784 family)